MQHRIQGVQLRFRPIVGLQVFVTAAATLISVWLGGPHGALSAGLGGSIGIVSILAFAAVASRGTPKSAAEALHGALRAEAVKIVLMVVLLWLVLATYKSVLAVALIGSFIVTVVVSTMAIFLVKT